MYKINQSLVDQMSMNKSYVVISHKDMVSIVQEPKPKLTIEKAEEAPERDGLEAELIIKRAQKEAQEIKKTAWEKGYEEGKDNAKKEMESFIKEQTAEAWKVFASVEKYKENMYNELQESVLQLSFDIAEKIVNIELQRDDKVYVGIVKDAILNIKGVDKFVLRVGRTEYDKFFKDGAQWLRDETGCVPFEVVCDPQMERGACILESDDKILNTSIALQLNKIRHVLDEKAQTHGKDF